MVPKNQNLISLFPPSFEGKVSVEEALLKRRSVRSFKEEPLTLKEISQILWAAQGITEPSFGGRTAPSAGALYPIEIYLIVKNVKELSPGVYKYQPENHSLVFLFEEKISSQLADAALGQSFIAKAPAVLVIAGVFERTTKKYGERGERYVFMEAGHVSQNVYLQCVSLNLGTVAVGAFEDEKVKQILKMDSKEYPLYIMPIGRK
ncbi:SagB/ThcOx family dehydrogenase [Candidatus Parcubacteria bacterium]|nr:SagB/ThcOx family dehydrogenase [Candidatus Parcubacteria bacterium]